MSETQNRTNSNAVRKDSSGAPASLKQVNAQASYQLKAFEQNRVSNRSTSSRQTRFDAAVSRIAT